MRVSAQVLVHAPDLVAHELVLVDRAQVALVVRVLADLVVHAQVALVDLALADLVVRVLVLVLVLVAPADLVVLVLVAHLVVAAPAAHLVVAVLVVHATVNAVLRVRSRVRVAAENSKNCSRSSRNTPTAMLLFQWAPSWWSVDLLHKNLLRS